MGSQGHSPQFSVHVYCGQTAGWIMTPLGTEVGLGPGHSVLDGLSALHERGTAAPLFSAHVYCGHGRPSQLLLSSCCYISPIWPQAPKRICTKFGTVVGVADLITCDHFCDTVRAVDSIRDQNSAFPIDISIFQLCVIYLMVSSKNGTHWGQSLLTQRCDVDVSIDIHFHCDK